MMHRLTPLVLLVAACGGGGGGSAACGLALLAGPTLIQQHLYNARAIITDVPRGLPGELPVRVIGRPSAKALVAYDAQGKIVMGYEGAGVLPAGFGLLVVDDTSQRAMGVLIYESLEPLEYPRLGVIGAGAIVLNVYGVRVDWASVTDPRCPLFDSLSTPPLPATPPSPTPAS